MLPFYIRPIKTFFFSLAVHGNYFFSNILLQTSLFQRNVLSVDQFSQKRLEIKVKLYLEKIDIVSYVHINKNEKIFLLASFYINED